MDRKEIQTHLRNIRGDGRLRNVINLAERQEALKLLDVIIHDLSVQTRWTRQPTLMAQAKLLLAELAGIDGSIFEQLWGRIQNAQLSPAACRQIFESYSAYGGLRGAEHIKLDGLDVLLDGLLGLHGWQPKIAAPAPNLAHYDPTPASAVLEMTTFVPILADSRFIDLGSGLGRVPMLAHLLTGCAASGIEIDPDLHERAQQAQAQLGLPLVDLQHGDARDRDLSQFDVVFMYTPFIGPVLHEVLNKLERRARQGPLTLCTLGPCTLQAAKLVWLKSADAHFDHVLKVAIFESVF
jgi:hypothetical protein